MRAKDLKTILVPLELGERTFKIAFDFNCMCELDEVYGDFDKAIKAIDEGKGRLKAIRALIYSAIKPRYEDITLIEVGELLTDIIRNTEKADYLMNQIDKALTLAMPDKEEVGE
ncbi:MAG: hypothetical protein SOX50_08620 [Terrisporobacter othiniensis]|uniref:hypothetical protein n=1 Tax=Terrisporobacter othiniensis TaxID=1577792 RepID=UPI002A74E6B5|nr:hypothetical protein [Terrisporobacter othiniensis]MDY3373321.1 hypothetical protein [Terrisporobacter othiniensis]